MVAYNKKIVYWDITQWYIIKGAMYDTKLRKLEGKNRQCPFASDNQDAIVCGDL